MTSSTVFTATFCRTWLKVRRRPVVLLLSFVQPVIWICFFGFLFQRFPLVGLSGDVRYLDFLIAGVCGMTVLLGASQSGIALIRDMQAGFLDRILQTPAGRLQLLGGKIAADVSRLILQAAVVAVIGLLLGARLSFPAGPILVGIMGIALFAVAWCSLSCLIALKTRSQETMAGFVHVTNMPVFFTSTALVPAKQMPGWLEAIAQWNPLTLAVSPLRDAMLLDPANVAISAGMLLLGVAAIVLFGIATRLLDSSR